MKLSALFHARYLPHIRRRLKPRTVVEYERLADTLVLPTFGDSELAAITLTRVEDWHEGQDALVQANRALALLSGLLGYAAKRDLLPANPCRGVHRNKERPREHFFMPAEAQTIVGAARAFPDIRGQYIALVLLTGCRPGELVETAVSWRYGAALRVPDSKTGVRTVYLPDAACAILDALTPAVGTSAGDHRYFPDDMDLRRAWTTILRSAGVPAARMYDLRHTFASAALAAGQSLSVVGLLLGHKKAQTTMRYVHLAPDTGLRAAAAAVERLGVQ